MYAIALVVAIAPHDYGFLPPVSNDNKVVNNDHIPVNVDVFWASQTWILVDVDGKGKVVAGVAQFWAC